MSFDYKDLINKFSKGTGVNEEDKDNFFSKVSGYFNVLELKVLWHISTHWDCAKKIFGTKELLLIAGAVAYVIMPLDAIPDYIPIVGLLDDAGVVGYILKQYSESIKKYKSLCM